ncbi:MAG: isopenicillin N synthase family oxygenase [Planctomycetaceae bacterium]|jgi:isopenicillin N synthase-like dioxygenase|nr:isopenicillin N synthase family oxygenase [Gammaproteobacteria bacterium]MBT6918522.1 isopenicillin N synthase family oxygenase [Planctomycetaceae bacterium]
MTIPIIDLAKWFDDQPPLTDPSNTDSSTAEQALAQEWDNAMRHYGFAVVVGHPVAGTQTDNLYRATREFFESNSPKEKQTFNHGPYGNPLGGYTGLGVESVGTTWELDNAPPDIVESYVFLGSPECWATREPNVAHPMALEHIAAPYVEQVMSLCRGIHRLSARALGVPDTFFENFFDSTSASELSLRLAYYPPTESHSMHRTSIRYGAHTDYTGYTFLYQDPNDLGNEESGGLQVLVNDQWVFVPSVPNSFVINAGDLWPIWSNGRWKSAVHRVTNPAEDSRYSRQSRISIPFFTGPRGDSLIEPIVRDGEDKIFSAIEAGQHLQAKLSASNV